MRNRAPRVNTPTRLGEESLKRSLRSVECTLCLTNLGTPTQRTKNQRTNPERRTLALTRAYPRFWVSSGGASPREWNHMRECRGQGYLRATSKAAEHGGTPVCSATVYLVHRPPAHLSRNPIPITHKYSPRPCPPSSELGHPSWLSPYL